MIEYDEKAQVSVGNMESIGFFEGENFFRLGLTIQTWHPYDCYAFWRRIRKLFQFIQKVNNFEVSMGNKRI